MFYTLLRALEHSLPMPVQYASTDVFHLLVVAASLKGHREPARGRLLDILQVLDTRGTGYLKRYTQ